MPNAIRQVAQVPESWEKKYEARNAELAATLNLANLSDRDRAFLATCQKIYERDSGASSPFEQFFCYLVTFVENGHWPTPSDVQQELEEFQSHFECMQRETRYFREAYPEHTS
jgi:hypothetical protein